MKKILFFIFFIFITNSFVFASEYEDPVSLYKDNYLIIGDKDDQTKFQISLKYNLIYPSKLGFFAGYTQKSFWKTYDNSSPFYETNYEPEIFYQFISGNNIFGNIQIPLIDYIQISPAHHLSNGRDREASRGMNTYYSEIQFSYGDIYNIGFNIKYFNYYNLSSKNKDYNDYRKNYESKIFFKIKSKNVKYLDKEEISCRFSGNPIDKGFFEVTGKVRIITTYFQPKIYIQYWQGYGEFLIDYNVKEKRFRVGIAY
ncbi:MAG TPA: phospholipase A [Candidatus Diapherotrites archaeon]|nr:phospholipase A [Candidatus Diapherotrites archaeon]